MKFRHNKKIIFVIATVLLLTVAVGTTLAFIVDSTTPVKNIFTSSKVATAVVEKLDNVQKDPVTNSPTNNSFTEKSDVQIKNTGDTEAYIRAAIIVTWKNADGKVWAQKPKDTDYSLTLGSSKWVKYGDYYYYTIPVAPGDSTEVLISSAAQLVEHVVVDSSGNNVTYNLSIEIVASAVQSTPADAVVAAWGFDPSTLGTNQ